MNKNPKWVGEIGTISNMFQTQKLSPSPRDFLCPYLKEEKSILLTNRSENNSEFKSATIFKIRE